VATITGTSGNNRLAGTSSNDILRALGGNDTLIGSAGTDFYDGGTGSDILDLRAASADVTVSFSDGTLSGAFNGTFVNMERVLAGGGSDILIGARGAQYLAGGAGEDILAGAAGVDTLWGGSGADYFVFREAGTGNADRIRDFASGSDKIVLDASVMSALGASGAFAAGDARFAANSSGTARDASDRVIYETDSRQIWYDADGSGAGARQLIATLQSGATLAATDIVVVGEGYITGTEGDDALTGTEGNDTIDGRGGNDVLHGLQGADFLYGAEGNDTLWGGGGIDTLWGGAGADTFVFREMGTTNADRVSGFVRGTHKIQLDDAAFTAIGAQGTFASGDGRFWFSSTGTAHDANDRVLYNTSTGSLYYDADGSGEGAAELIATFAGNPLIAATDIVVI
jgi:serralysin